MLGIKTDALFPVSFPCSHWAKSLAPNAAYPEEQGCCFTSSWADLLSLLHPVCSWTGGGGSSSFSLLSSCSCTLSPPEGSGQSCFICGSTDPCSAGCSSDCSPHDRSTVLGLIAPCSEPPATSRHVVTSAHHMAGTGSTSFELASKVVSREVSEEAITNVLPQVPYSS